MFAVPRGTPEPTPKTFSVPLTPAPAAASDATPAPAAAARDATPAPAAACGAATAPAAMRGATTAPAAMRGATQALGAASGATHSHDAALIAILDSHLRPGETAAAGFHRKEVELGNIFAKLTVLESRALNARLANPKTGDALADKFSRLTSERRARLLTFLADARRREAIATARR